MLEFVITNYLIFIIIAVVLLLGLFGYMMDKKKYEQYREEILNQEKTMEMLEKGPEIQSVATAVPVGTSPEVSAVQDPMTGSMNQ